MSRDSNSHEVEEWKSKVFVPEDYIAIDREFKRLKKIIRTQEIEIAELKDRIKTLKKLTTNER